jgi:uncharacterized protein (TIGR02147 family)
MDVRLFLQDFYRLRKEQDPEYSYNRWASEVGFSNKTLLRLILQGKRKITIKSTSAFKNFFQFDDLEKDYFDVLVEYSQAKGGQQRKALGARLLELNRQKFAQKIVSAGGGILKDCYGPLVVTVISSSEEPISCDEVAIYLDLEADHTQVILDGLVKAGLIVAKKGLYVANQSTFKIADQFNNAELKNYYRYWLGQSVTAIDLPVAVRRFRSLKIVLSAEEYDEVVERLNEFSLTLLTRFEKNSIRDRNLYLINTAIFPVGMQKSEDG